MRDLAYNSWKSMMARCYNTSHKYYNYYGGNGITVCDSWHDFDNFYADMGGRTKGLSIDRIDNSKGYDKDNCRWVTAKEQANNRKSNVFIMGKTIAQWADHIGCNPSVLQQRLKMGWSESDVVSKPVASNNEISYKGVTKNIRQWSIDTGIPYTTLVSRFKRGLNPEGVLKGASV